MLTDDRIREIAETIRRELDDMAYYEGTLRRDGCIAQHMREAVREALEADRALPPEPRPVTHEREAEIRRRDAAFSNRLEPSLVASTMCRELLLLLDHERKARGKDVAVLTDRLVEDGAFEMGRQAGRAEILPLVRSMLESRRMHASVAATPSQRAQHGEIAGVLEVLEKVLTHPIEPQVAPHLVVLAENQRMREGLAKIANSAGNYDSSKAAECQKIAREALESP